MDTHLNRFISNAAIAWVDRVFGELTSQDRPIAGGWPGTLSQARAQVVATLNANRVAGVTDTAREDLARQVYQMARQRWRQNCVSGE